MKTTLKKITAISLAAISFAFSTSIMSLASEAPGKAESGKESSSFYYGDVAEEYKNGAWDYEDDSCVFYDTETSYEGGSYTA